MSQPLSQIGLQNAMLIADNFRRDQLLRSIAVVGDTISSAHASSGIIQIISAETSQYTNNALQGQAVSTGLPFITNYRHGAMKENGERKGSGAGPNGTGELWEEQTKARKNGSANVELGQADTRYYNGLEFRFLPSVALGEGCYITLVNQVFRETQYEIIMKNGKPKLGSLKEAPAGMPADFFERTLSIDGPKKEGENPEYKYQGSDTDPATKATYYYKTDDAGVIALVYEKAYMSAIGGERLLDIKEVCVTVIHHLWSLALEVCPKTKTWTNLGYTYQDLEMKACYDPANFIAKVPTVKLANFASGAKGAKDPDRVKFEEQLQKYKDTWPR